MRVLLTVIGPHEVIQGQSRPGVATLAASAQAAFNSSSRSIALGGAGAALGGLACPDGVPCAPAGCAAKPRRKASARTREGPHRVEPMPDYSLPSAPGDSATRIAVRCGMTCRPRARPIAQLRAQSPLLVPDRRRPSVASVHRGPKGKPAVVRRGQSRSYRRPTRPKRFRHTCLDNEVAAITTAGLVDEGSPASVSS